MKVFDSGMPGESYWNSLFDVPAIVEWLGLGSIKGPIAEIGCGYGTFTVPIAQQTTQIVDAFDLEPEMIRVVGANASEAGLQNVSLHLRDVLEEGTGLAASSVGLVLLFNILHSPERTQLLQEASRILKPAGRIAILHWRKDIPTPRGPSVDSRPDAGIIRQSIEGLALRFLGDSRILEPYHWGVQLLKGVN